LRPWRSRTGLAAALSRSTWDSCNSSLRRPFFRALSLREGVSAKAELPNHGSALALEARKVRRVNFMRLGLNVSSGSSLDLPDRVAAGFLVRLQLHQTAFLRFQQQIAEGTEAISALVESRAPSFDGLLDHRTLNAFILIPFLGEGRKGLQHQFQLLL